MKELLDAFGRPARPRSMPVFNEQLRRHLYDAMKDETCFGWMARQVLGPDGRSAGRGFVVRFTRYEALPAL